MIENPHCPLPEKIYIHCGRNKGTKWCTDDSSCRPKNSDEDEEFPRFCCPTVCNYNVCVVKFGRRFIVV